MHCPHFYFLYRVVKAEEHNDVSIKSDSHWSYWDFGLVGAVSNSLIQIYQQQEKGFDPELQQFHATLQKQA